MPSFRRAKISLFVLGGLSNNICLVRAQPLMQEVYAKGDGMTDDAGPLNAAFAAAARTHTKIVLPTGTYRVASTLQVGAASVEGSGFSPTNPPLGTIIKCDAGVSPCIRIGGNNATPSLRRLAVIGTGGAPSGAVGIEVEDAYNATLEDVMTFNHGVCYRFSGRPKKGLGLGAYMTRTFSGNCADAHIVVDGWPELRISQGRYGMNGEQRPSKTFIRFQGGVNGTAGGPNTFDVENSQFNAPSTHFVEFVNLGDGARDANVPGIDATDFKFHGLHVEGVSGAYFFSDASWNIVNRVNVSGSNFNDGAPFIALDPASQVSEWNIENNQIFGPMTFGPGRNENALLIIGNRLGATTLNAAVNGGGTATVVGNSFNGAGLTLNGNWGALSVGYNLFISGALTNHATGKVLVQN